MRDQRGERLQTPSSAKLPPTIPNEVPMRRIGLAVVLALGLFFVPLAVEHSRPVQSESDGVFVWGCV